MSSSLSVLPLVAITLLAMGLAPAGAVRPSIEVETEDALEVNMTAGGGKTCVITEKVDVYNYGVSFAVPIIGKCSLMNCHGMPSWGTSDSDVSSIYKKIITAVPGGHRKCQCMVEDYEFYWFRASAPQCTSTSCWYEFSTQMRQKAGKTASNDLLTAPQHFDYTCADEAPSPANLLPGMPPPSESEGATILASSDDVDSRIAELEAKVKDVLESQEKGELFNPAGWQVILDWHGEVDLDIHMTWGENHLQSGLLVTGADHVAPFMLDVDDQGQDTGDHVEHINLDEKDATLPNGKYQIYVVCFADNRDADSASLPFPFQVSMNFGGSMGWKLMESKVCAGTKAQDVIKFTVADHSISIGD